MVECSRYIHVYALCMWAMIVALLVQITARVDSSVTSSFFHGVPVVIRGGCILRGASCNVAWITREMGRYIRYLHIKDKV